MMQKGPIAHNDGIFSEESFFQLFSYVTKKLTDTPLLLEQSLNTVEDLPDMFPFHWKLISIKKPYEECAHYVVDLTKSLGKGGQGEVFLGQHLQDPTHLVAVKKPDPKSMSLQEDICRERRNLELTNRLIGIARSNAFNEYTVMEYYPGKDLLHWLYEIDERPGIEGGERYKARAQLPHLLRMRFALLVIGQVIILHDLQIAHRDLKTANFIVDAHGPLNQHIVLKLVDLGSGVLLKQTDPEKCKEIAGTFGYNDPMLFVPLAERQPYHFKNDLFSLGIVLAEILTEYNYQRSLREKMRQQTRIGKKGELSFEEMVSMMPDVLSEAWSTEVTWEGAWEKTREPNAFEKAQPQLFFKIKQLIARLVSANNCPSLEELKEIYNDLVHKVQLSLVLSFPRALPSSAPSSHNGSYLTPLLPNAITGSESDLRFSRTPSPSPEISSQLGISPNVGGSVSSQFNKKLPVPSASPRDKYSPTSPRSPRSVGSSPATSTESSPHSLNGSNPSPVTASLHPSPKSSAMTKIMALLKLPGASRAKPLQNNEEGYGAQHEGESLSSQGPTSPRARLEKASPPARQGKVAASTLVRNDEPPYNELVERLNTLMLSSCAPTAGVQTPAGNESPILNVQQNFSHSERKDKKEKGEKKEKGNKKEKKREKDLKAHDKRLPDRQNGHPKKLP